MNICVCIKQVPDTNLIKIDPVTHTLVRKGVPSIVNPFDTYAEEMAVRLKEAHGGRVIVLSMGPDQAKKALVSCLEVGADGAYLVSDRVFGGSDTLATSYILSTAIREIEKRENLKFDLILCGKQAVDGDTAQVGPEIAEHLGMAQITYATEIRLDGDELIVRRATEDGFETVAAKLPVVVTAEKSDVEPRYASIFTRRSARKAEIPVLTSKELSEISTERCGLGGSPTKVKRTYTPELHKANVRIEGKGAEESAGTLLALLKDRKIL